MVIRMTRVLMVMCLALLLAIDFSMAAGRNPEKNTTTTTGKASEVNAQQAISNWPSTSKQAAMAMLQKYGQPDGVTPDHLMWMNKGNFHEIDVFKEEVEHNFPTRHMDVIKHTVFMRVPAEKVADLSEFDGSITVNRTRGTVSSFCDSEEHNILALNLASDIVNNQKSIQEARQQFAALEGVGGTFGANTPNLDRGYIDALRFNVTSPTTVRDPGQSFTGSNTGTSGTGTGTGTGMGTGMGTGRDTGMGMGAGNRTRMGDTLRSDTGMNRTGRNRRGTFSDTLNTRDTLNTDTTLINNRGTGTTPR